MAQPNASSFVMTRLPWIIAAVAVLALLATLFLKSSGERATQPDTQELLARLEALERERGGVGVSPGRRANSPMTTGAGGAYPTDPLTGREQKTPEQMEADRVRDLQMLEAAFARDKADPVRGGQVERKLEATVTSESMAGTGLKPDDVAIDCRATTCKVVGQFAKRGDAEDWALFYVTSAGGNVLTQTRMAYVPRPDGSTEVRIYATRAR